MIKIGLLIDDDERPVKSRDELPCPALDPTEPAPLWIVLALGYLNAPVEAGTL